MDCSPVVKNLVSEIKIFEPINLCGLLQIIEIF